MSPKQEAFVREYLIDLNATQAAIRAGYSAHTANEQGARLLANVSVRSHIEAAQVERAKRTEIDADWVLRRLHADATADLADIYDEQGHLLPVREWPMVFRTGLVTGIETEQERIGVDADGKPMYATVRKVKLLDRVRMLEMIGKHIGVQAFKERVDVGVSLADLVREARARLDEKRGA